MSAVTFNVPGEPMSKERPRWNGARTYTPPRTQAAEARVIAAWLQCKSRRRMDGDLAVTIRFYAATKTRRDLDNMAKLVLDALNDRAYHDDSQIQSLTLTRSYVSKGEASTTVTIAHLEQGRTA